MSNPHDTPDHRDETLTRRTHEQPGANDVEQQGRPATPPDHLPESPEDKSTVTRTRNKPIEEVVAEHPGLADAPVDTPVTAQRVADVAPLEAGNVRSDGEPIGAPGTPVLADRENKQLRPGSEPKVGQSVSFFEDDEDQSTVDGVKMIAAKIMAVTDPGNFVVDLKLYRMPGDSNTNHEVFGVPFGFEAGQWTETR